jgi:hypothetical protein
VANATRIGVNGPRVSTARNTRSDVVVAGSAPSHSLDLDMI